MAIHLSIAEEFSETPGPRYRSEGEYSGEQFREELLEPAFLKIRGNKKQLIVNLDGTAGYATSFLEEAFGGLARKHDPTEVTQTIALECSEEPGLVQEVMNYIRDARAKQFAR